MAKYYGKVGYVKTVEIEPGLWDEQPTESEYFGDTLQNTIRSTMPIDSTNRDFILNVQISIVADPYAIDHFSEIRYAEYMGTMWSVTSANPQYPRILLTLGGLYNGKQVETAE